MNIKSIYTVGAAFCCLTIFSGCDFESNKTKSDKLCDRALVEFKVKNYKVSLADYRKAAELDSTNGRAFEGMGSNQYHLKKYDSALSNEFKAQRLNPELKNVNNWIGLIKSELGDYQGSIEYYNKSIEQGGEDIAKDYVGRGADFYDLGDYDKAMQDETKAIQMDADIENGYYWRALIKERMGDYKGSIEDHLKSLDHVANKGMDYEDLAVDESYLGDNTKALEYINMAIPADSTLKNAYNWRAAIKHDMGDYKGSAEDYTASLKIGANKGKDYEGRAIDEYHLKDYTDALSDINLAIQSDTTLKQATGWKKSIEEALRK